MALLMFNFTPYYYKNLNKAQTLYDKFFKMYTQKYYKSFDTQEKRVIYFVSFNSNTCKKAAYELVQSLKLQILNTSKDCPLGSYNITIYQEIGFL